jgi:hypothetical protein
MPRPRAIRPAGASLSVTPAARGRHPRAAFIALNAVWLQPVDGGRARKTVEAVPQFLIQSLNWSRDGRYLLYSVRPDRSCPVGDRRCGAGE